MKNSTVLNCLAKHIFKTQRLSAQLRVIILESTSLAFLIFHGTERSVAVPFNNVALAGESQPVRKYRQRPQQLHTFGNFITGQIRMLMGKIAEYCVYVVHKYALDVYEGSAS